MTECQREKGPECLALRADFSPSPMVGTTEKGSKSFHFSVKKNSSILFKLPSARNRKPSFWVHSEKKRLLEIMEECVRSQSTLSGPKFVPQDPPAWFSQYFKFAMEECEGTLQATLPDFESLFWDTIFTFSRFSQ